MKRKIVLIAAVLIALAVPGTATAEPLYEDTYCSAHQQELCEIYGKKYCISPQMLEAIAEIESSADNSKTNGSCYGLMQVNADVHGYGYKTEEQQIEKACQILVQHLEEEPDIAYALDCYGGISKAKSNYEQGIVSKYAQKVLDRTFEIERAQGI